MTDAIIIPFPRRQPRMHEEGSADQDRLRRALANLQAALDEQFQALSDWRFAITELGIGVAGLSHSMDIYQTSLGGVEERLGELGRHSARLEALAEGMGAQATGSPPGFG